MTHVSLKTWKMWSYTWINCGITRVRLPDFFRHHLSPHYILLLYVLPLMSFFSWGSSFTPTFFLFISLERKYTVLLTHYFFMSLLQPQLPVTSQQYLNFSLSLSMYLSFPRYLSVIFEANPFTSSDLRRSYWMSVCATGGLFYFISFFSSETPHTHKRETHSSY